MCVVFWLLFCLLVCGLFFLFKFLRFFGAVLSFCVLFQLLCV